MFEGEENHSSFYPVDGKDEQESKVKLIRRREGKRGRKRDDQGKRVW